MGKKKKAAAAETAAAVTKNLPEDKQSARAAAFLQAKNQKQMRIALLAGAAMLLLCCLGIGDSQKFFVMVTLLAGVAVMLVKRRALRARFGVAALALTAYCLMITASAFYAPAGKFALTESIKYISALAVFFMVLALEPDEQPGRCSATAVELSAACVSLLSIDAAGARLLSGAILPVFSALTGAYRNLEMLDRGHINSIFGNVNIFSGIAGLGVLVGLGLLSAERDAKRRRVHLVCLAVNAAAFLDAFSRGATVVIAVSFLVYLFLECGESRSRALMLMVETAVFAGIAAIVGYLTAFGSSGEMRFAALAATLLCAAGLAAFDEFVGQRLADKLAPHSKAVTVAIAALLGAVAVFAVAALNLTGPASIGGDAVLYRASYPAAGMQTLRVEADGEVSVSVRYQSEASSFSGADTLYEGAADGATFEVPESASVVMLSFSGEDDCTITRVYYEGAENKPVKLRYLLIPEKLASMIQGIFQGTSFTQRLVYWQDAMKLWRTSPIVGLGVGCFENKAIGIQKYHYESKYVHNHYVQALLDTGVIGLVLFVGTLLACALSLLLARRKEESNPLLSALGACLLFMAGQACTDIVFSSASYLPVAFAVLALVVVCSGGVLRLPVSEKAEVWLPRGGLALLAVWVALLGFNLYGNSKMQNPSYAGLARAEKLDFFERNDYRLSYVYSACDNENRTDEMTAQMYEYMEKLKKVPSNTIPYYLGYAYFSLGDTAEAFEMLRQYTAYSAASEEKWDEAFRLAVGFYEDSAAYTDGMASLYQSMLDWNAQSLKPIVLADDIEGFVTSLISVK